MSRDDQIKALAMKQVVYTLPGMHDIVPRGEVRYGGCDDAVRTMDIYYPPDVTSRAPPPLVILVNGYPMPADWTRQWEPLVSWARLFATRGMASIIYACKDPATDIHTLLQYLDENTQSLAIDNNRIGLLATSGNVPNALSLVMNRRYDNFRCAALCYGYMLDINGRHSVADAARQWGFENPSEGKTVDDVPGDLPLFIARAGQDHFPGINAGIDAFAITALERNLPFTLVNHAGGPHAFDMDDDSEASRYVIEQLLAFMSSHLCGDEDTID